MTTARVPPPPTKQQTPKSSKHAKSPCEPPSPRASTANTNLSKQRLARPYIRSSITQLNPAFLFSYLPSWGGGDHEGPSPKGLLCIARRGSGLLTISFGGLFRAIFDGFSFEKVLFIVCLAVCWTSKKKSEACAARREWGHALELL